MARAFIGQGREQDPEEFVRRLMKDYRIAPKASIAEAETAPPDKAPQFVQGLELKG